MTNKKILLLLIVISFTSLFSQNKRYTDYYITAGADINLNFHIADFIKLSGIPNCCNGFENTIGLGYNLFVGMDYMLDKNFLYGLKYSAQISLSDLSGDYKTNEFIGNDLLEDGYRPITVEHNLKTDLMYMNIGQAFVLNPLENIPLGVKLGFDVGFPIATDYEQYEKLIEPEDVFFQGGGKERNKFSGKIPLAESYYFAIKAGLRYSIFKSNSYEIVPQIEYAYSFSNVTSAQDWAVDVLRAGIAVHYNIPKKDLPKPIDPPSAKPIEPVLDFNKGILAVSEPIFYNQDTEVNKLLPIVVYNPKVKETKIEAIPLTFFYNSSLENDNFSPLANPQFDLIEKLNEYIQQNSTDKIELVSYSPDESDEIQNNRIEFLKSKLKTENIDSRIAKISKKQINRTEIEDEYRKIDVLINNEKFAVFTGTKEIPTTFDNINNSANVLFNDKTTEFQYKINLKNDNAISEYKIALDETPIMNLPNVSTLKRGVNELSGSFSVYFNEVKPINFHISIADAEGQKYNSTFPLNFIRKDTIVAEKVNFVQSTNTDDSFQQFTIGYFDFDKISFAYIDSKAIENIKAYISQGSNIEIIAMTDNFGSEEYNIKLAEKRAATTLKLIGIASENAKVTLKNGGIYNNDNPYNRIMNRAVIVRLSK